MKTHIHPAVILSAALLVCIGGVIPAHSKIHTRRIENLSNSSVNIIYQDSSEYVWIGTWDGLNRYDGERIRSYFPEPGNSSSISNNIIRDIQEEREGILWVSTDWGINRLDIRTGKFQRHFLGYEDSFPTKEDIYSVAISSKGDVFASAWRWGLAVYDHAGGTFRTINSAKFNTQDLLAAEMDPDDNLWLHDDSGSVTRVKWELMDGEVNIIDAEIRDSADIGYFDIRDSCIITVDKADSLEIRRYDEDTPLLSMPLSGEVMNVCILDRNIIIIYKNGKSERIPMAGPGREEQRIYPADVPNITCHMAGTQGTTWTGTDGNGVYVSYEQKNHFGKILFRETLWPVRAIIEDSAGNVIAGTKGGGLYMECRNGRNIQFTTDNGLLSNRVYSLCRNGRGDIFIGTEGAGVNILSEGHIRKLDFKGADYSHVSEIYSMALTEDDTSLWLGTAYNGLIRIELCYSEGGISAGRIETFPWRTGKSEPHGNAIYKIIPAGEKLFIASRGSGVLCLDLRTGTYKETEYTDSSVSNIIDNSDVLSLLMGRDSSMWVGTSLGLDRLTLKDGRLEAEVFIHKNNLPNNTIHGILEDPAGNIWLSTNNGLAKLNPKTDEIVSYMESDGLQGNEFSDGAYYAGKDGCLYFGGTKGLNRFYPENIVPDEYMPRLHMEDICVNNLPLRFNVLSPGDTGFLPKFSHNENNISLRLSVTDFINNRNCEFSYFLDGYSKDWTYMGNTKNLFFPDAGPGKYRLHIRYTNGAKRWSGPVEALSFTIRPPLWKTGWAWLCYSIGIASAAGLCMYKLRKKIETDRKEFERKITEREKELTTREKIRVLTGMADEFITPLSLIYGPSIRIEDYSKADSYVRKYASIIHNNAKRLSRLISEMSDYHNALAGTEPVFEYLALDDYVATVVNSLSELAERKGLEVIMKADVRPVMCVSDKYCIEKILFSMISYTYRTSQNNSTVDIESKAGQDGITMDIIWKQAGGSSADTGEKEDTDSIFRSLITKTGGKTDTYRTDDGMTVRTLTLPVREVSEKMVQQYEIEQRVRLFPDRSDARTNNLLADKAVLIIDEDTDLRMLIRDSLNEGCRIFESGTVQEGYRILKEQNIDLIILDTFVQGVSGVDFIRKIKDDSIFQHIPILFISRNLDEKYKNLALTSGVDTIINMPFNPNHFRNIVNSIFNQREIYEKYSKSAMSTMDMDKGTLLHHEDKIFLDTLSRMIEERLEQDTISIDLICKELNINKVTLCRKIKKLSGQTLSNYIKSIKLRKATYLLKSTRMSVKEIMYSCGYNHKSLFYKHFEQTYGTTPKEWRESLFRQRQEAV